MADAERHLARWRAAGLIDEAIEQRILEFEADSRAEAEPAATGTERPSLVEALLYVGFGIALAGAYALTAQQWGTLSAVTRITMLAGPGVLGLLAGLLMRQSADPALRRAAGVAWLVAVALLAGAVAELGSVAGWSAERTALLSSVMATVLSVALWERHRSRPQLFAIAGSLVFLAESVAAQGHPYYPELAGFLVLLGGSAGVVAAEVEMLMPKGAAAGLATLLIVTGAMHIQIADDSVWTGLPALAAGFALIALSVRRAGFSYLLGGVLALFFGLVIFIFQHFEHTIGVPAALLLTGCLLVGLVLGVSMWRRRRAAPPAAPVSPAGDCC